MTLHPSLALVSLKRKSAPMDTRALPLPSIVASFCQLPSLASVVGTVVLDVCHRALAAARASSATLREGGQSDSKPATTRGGPAAVGTAGPWPRYGVPALRRLDAPSD